MLAKVMSDAKSSSQFSPSSSSSLALLSTMERCRLFCSPGLCGEGSAEVDGSAVNESADVRVGKDGTVGLLNSPASGL